MPHVPAPVIEKLGAGLRFASYLLIFFSGFVFSDVTYTVNSNESGDAHIITVKRDSDTAEGLDVIWIKKAESICPNGIARVEPESQPILKNKACSDAIEVINGIQRCEDMPASAFGKVVCKRT
ncbi:hypothetical protein E5672_19565 [Alteromonas portus]|uniref:Uncharacterized protein n=1 Tax=Alteromonas portus TaxID=2565549 RepID=A0A4U0ZAJ3_9ALTE|nr:hypothetical protein [Alteromonas portus]TKB00685.1 hypothetical protein E5672_19565 [Alteromonas portus]